MSFGGSVSAMISSLRNNKNLLSKRKHFRDVGSETHYRVGKSLKYKELSLKDLNRVKANIRAKAIRNQRIRMVVIVFLLIIISAGIYSAINKVNNGYVEKYTKELQEKERQIEQLENKEAKEKEELVVYFLNKGYECMSQGKYDYAKYYLFKIYHYGGDDFRAVLAYTRAYVYDFINNNKGCEKALDLLEKLKQKYGDKMEVKELLILYKEIGHE